MRVVVEPSSSREKASTHPVGPLSRTGRIRGRTDDKAFVPPVMCPLNESSASLLLVCGCGGVSLPGCTEC